MKKTFYNHWWFWVLVIIMGLFLIAGVPLIINQCYIKNNGYLTVWGGSEVFAYYASVLSFIGTLTLGIITVWQNRKTISINDRLFNIELKRKMGYFIPQHKIRNPNSGITCNYLHDLEKNGIVLLGTGEDIINVNKAVVNVNERVFEDKYRIFITTSNEFRELIVPVNLTEQEKKLSEISITLRLYLENSTKYQYIQILFLSFKKNSDNCYLLTAFNSEIVDAN